LFDLFETFICLYETKSFTTTSNYLFVTQSTITKRLQKLESELNTTLFCRKNIKQIAPTPEADTLYPIALNFVKTWQSTQRKFQNNLEKTTLKIGVSQSSATLILPKLFILLKDDLKQLNLKIRIYDSKKIASLIETNILDIGIIDQDFSSPKINKFNLFKDKLVLAGDTNTNIFFVREIKLQLGHFVKQFLKEEKFHFEHLVHMNDNETILNHVKQGLGVSLLPKRMLTKDVPFQDLTSDYLLYYSIIFHSNDNRPTIKNIFDKITKNIDWLSETSVI